MSAFDRALALTLRYEGGYADHPDDPGGATMKGITQVVYNGWRRAQGLPRRPVRGITDEEVHEIYRQNYWIAGSCDNLPEPLSIVHFDACVNHGIKQASKLLQRAVGANDDGDIGPNTLAAVSAFDTHRAVRNQIRERIDFYVLLWMRRPPLRVFMGGWISRARHIEDAVLEGTER